MPVYPDQLTDKQRRFIAEQPMFFVATAPRADDGLINLSPKGLQGSFAILDDSTVAYLDLTGSGVETIAHLKENGRICVMFCAFVGRPNILRLQGTGEPIEPSHPEFGQLLKHFPEAPGVRSVIRIHIHRIADSCGYGVPRMQYLEDRTDLTDWSNKIGIDGVKAYQSKKNRKSLDGLPGLTPAE